MYFISQSKTCKYLESMVNTDHISGFLPKIINRHRPDHQIKDIFNTHIKDLKEFSLNFSDLI